MPPRAPQQRQLPNAKVSPKTKTVQYREWLGVNLTDARIAIDDREASWLENVLPVGKGSYQILPGPGLPISSIGEGGIVSLWGFTLNGVAVLMAVTGNGSLVQINALTGFATIVAGPGTVTSLARLTIWQGTPILIIDPVKGYMSWDGTTFTVIDAMHTGSAIAVFQGRVFTSLNRTLTFSAPNSFANFNPADGGGSTVITDEAFQGNIIALASALEELWIIGQGAIEALANVTATGVSPNVTTSFSITNIVTNLGSNSPASVIGYYRSLAFLAPYGAYALSGVTPQKLSEKLDGLFTDLTLTPDVPAAVAVVQSLLCLFFLVTYHGTQAQAGPPPIKLVLGFEQGKWFFATQGPLVWITTLIVNGVSQAWGTDGQLVYQLFGATPTTTVVYKIQSKLYDYTDATREKAITKVGFEFQTISVINPRFTVDNESGSLAVPIQSSNLIIGFTNNVGEIIQFTNNVGDVIEFLTGGLILSRQDVPFFGRYLGWTLTGNDPPYRVQSVEFEYTPTREWQAP